MTGPVRYFFLMARGKDDVPNWPPKLKPLTGPDNNVCAAVRLHLENIGWSAKCDDMAPLESSGADGSNATTNLALLLTRDTALSLLSDGKRGRAEVDLLGVRVVNLDEKGTDFATHLVVAALPGSGLGARRPVVVPIDDMVLGEYIERGDRALAALDLRLSPRDYETMPPFMADEAIQRHAKDTLARRVFASNAYSYGQIRHQDMTVEVQAGRVSLHGRASLRSEGEQAIAALMQTPGVVEVADHLLYVEDLQEKVEQALAAKGLGDLTVLVEHALVNLRGEVHDAKTRYQAEDIAKRVPGVRGVVNDLVVTTPV
jgi:BON domain